MARNKSNNSQYIKTDINYDKLAEAIVKAHKRIKDTEEKEAQRREKKERERMDSRMRSQRTVKKPPSTLMSTPLR